MNSTMNEEQQIKLNHLQTRHVPRGGLEDIKQFV